MSGDWSAIHWCTVSESGLDARVNLQFEFVNP
jgi:hypothetical protein